MKIENTVFLAVPEERQIQVTLAGAAKTIIRDRSVRPPLTLSQLDDLAREVIRLTGYDIIYHEFAMVLCGNEAWRNIVETTPFNRRLLLLPQCLKHEKYCQGITDQLGLICAGCQNCSIDIIISRAEELGYATLIAEGTSIAIEFVQEGSVDAIIGISCMSVLQKSFEMVCQAAVPVIGIPLQFEGCSNTRVDIEWVMEEINKHIPNEQYRPLSVVTLKEKIQSWYNRANLIAAFAETENETLNMAIDSILSGGQRMRPLMAAMAYQAYSDEPSAEIMNSLSVIVETFHKASLIHDDIEDRDDYRYEKVSLHKKNGIPLAINTGDYLLGKGYQLLGNLPLKPEILAQCFKLVANGHVALSIGQGDDILSSRFNEILSLEKLLENYKLKTGSAIRVALLLGAVAAGASDEEVNTLGTFSDYLGIAYQIRDDLSEFQLKDKTGKPENFPVLIACLLQNCKPEIKEQLQYLMLENDWDKLSLIIKENEAEMQTTTLLDDYISKAYQQLDMLKNFQLRLGLYSIMGKIF